MTESFSVKCTEPDCDCYPFIHFICEYCNKVWVTHCRAGIQLSGLCLNCFEQEQYVTNQFLNLATRLGLIELDSLIWFHQFQNRLRSKLQATAWIITIECHRLNKVPCSADPVDLCQWGIFKQRYASRPWHETTDDDSCCQEDGLPCCWPYPSGRRARQRVVNGGSSPDKPESSCVPQ